MTISLSILQLAAIWLLCGAVFGMATCALSGEKPRAIHLLAIIAGVIPWVVVLAMTIAGFCRVVASKGHTE